jgi:Fucosyltransferase, N-terminal
VFQNSLNLAFEFRSPETWSSIYRGSTDIFNITMTYRFDSDITWFYATVVDLETKETIAPAKNVTWRQPDEDFEGV